MPHIELALWAGLAIGLIFGACGQITGFCLQRGLVERWSQHGGGKLRAFAVALAVAILGTQALAAFGLVDLGSSLYLALSYSWLLLPVGGVMFGYGMGLANGCGARALVLLGSGNLRSLFMLLFLGITAYVTLTGVLGSLRVSVAESTTVSPALLTVPQGGWRTLVTLGVAALLLGFALRPPGLVRYAKDLIGGAIIGLLVVAGWLATGWLGHDDFDPLPVSSLTFVAPIGDVIQYAMLATGMNLRFGITVVAGVVAGALICAVWRREYRLQGFENPRHMLRHMAGGALMGAGGALALGCSIGQGLTGLSTLSFSSVLAAAGIVLGSRLAWRQTSR